MDDLVEFRILGQKIAIKSLDDKESVKRVALYLEEKIDRVRQSNGVVDSHRLLLYTAFQMASENVKVKGELDRLEEDVDLVSSGLLELIVRK